MESKHEEQVNQFLFKESSSPFGMILDHGADALSSSMITVQTMEILQY